MQIPEQWYGGDAPTLTQYFLHELCHALYFLTGTYPDLTHNFYNTPFAQETVNAYPNYYLSLIKSMIPAWNKYKNGDINVITQPVGQPIVTVTRIKDDGKETVGQLRTTNFGADTLERPWLNNQRDISCIPKGTYRCEWTFSLGHLGWTYEVLNVPNRSGIRIHKGNYFSDTEGCILLGGTFTDLNKDGEPDILNTNTIVPSFEKLMGKKPFILNII